MSLIKRLLKMAGKENFHLDPDISAGYLWMLFTKYGLMMAREKLNVPAVRAMWGKESG